MRMNSCVPAPSVFQLSSFVTEYQIVYMVGANKTVRYPTVVKYDGTLVTMTVAFTRFVSYI